MKKQKNKETIKNSIEKSKQKKILCPKCNSNNCFEEIYPNTDIIGYLCYSCGYTSTSKFKPGSDIEIQAIKSQPDFIRNNVFYDKERDINWYMAVVQTTNGTIFPEPDENNWHWTYAPIKEILEKDLEAYPIPGKTGSFYSHRLAIEEGIKYDNTDFLSACKKLGIFKDFLGKDNGSKKKS